MSQLTPDEARIAAAELRCTQRLKTLEAGSTTPGIRSGQPSSMAPKLLGRLRKSWSGRLRRVAEQRCLLETTNSSKPSPGI